MGELDESMGLLKTCLEFLVLGLIQGLTEFLPISSTAHLKVVPILLGWGDPGVSVAAVLQLGSIFAVIAYFRKDLKKILKGIFSAFSNGKWGNTDARLGIAIFISILPIVLSGMLIKVFWVGYSESLLRSVPFIALTSILMASFLALGEKFGSRIKEINDVRPIDGLIIGIAQIFALIPGVSRSGITLTTALIYGWKRDSGAKFSFLIGIPAIILAGIVELKDSFVSPELKEFLPIILGMLSSAAVSWLAIDWLLNFFQKNNSWIFVAYRLLFGLLLLMWWNQSAASN